MDKTIEIAKCTLADIFDIRKQEFDRPLSRKREVVEARRFLIYYLVDELGMRFLHIPPKMKSITSHATAMHHFYKMIDLLELETSTKEKYTNFKNIMAEKGMNTLENEMAKQIKLKNAISRNINNLKQMINEA
tara:strand:+ start:2271 stop:2669 length:399 start_codon:yes stop_codon:yes gene_type:complete